MSTTKPLLVLLHGAAGTHAMWAPQARGLADVIEVTTLDLPAHGARASEPFSFDSAAHAVSDVIDQDGRDDVYLGGLSLGGYVAMDWAARFPRRLSGLILSGCTIDYSRGSYPFIARANRVALKIYPKRLLDRLNSAAIRRTYPSWSEEIVAAGFYWSGYAQALGPLGRKYFPDGLRSFTRPVLLITGEEDRRNRREEQRFLRTVVRCESIVLLGAGHLCSLDDPEAFNAAVRRFITSGSVLD